MRKLSNAGEAWRNYLYANYDGKYNDVEDFLTRIELISDSQEQLWNEWLSV